MLYRSPQPNQPLRQQKLSYEILAIDEATNFVLLRVETPLGWAQERQLYLAADRRSFVESINIMRHSFRREWRHVDGQQQP
jgi:hypothetical protein